MLKQENILTKLLGEKNYLFWMDGLGKVSSNMPKTTSDYRMAMLIRGSIANEHDKKNTQSMTSVSEITCYLEQKYMNSPNRLRHTLSELTVKKMPRTYQQAADNIATTITMGRLLENVGLLAQVELSQLAMLKSKCILPGTHKELYNQKQIEHLVAGEEKIPKPRSSTPIMGHSLREEDGDEPSNASMAMAQMSMSLSKAQSGADSAKRRRFFFEYLTM